MPRAKNKLFLFHSPRSSAAEYFGLWMARFQNGKIGAMALAAEAYFSFPRFLGSTPWAEQDCEHLPAFEFRTEAAESEPSPKKGPSHERIDDFENSTSMWAGHRGPQSCLCSSWFPFQSHATKGVFVFRVPFLVGFQGKATGKPPLGVP